MNRRYLLTSLKIKLEKFQQPPKMKNEKKKKKCKAKWFLFPKSNPIWEKFYFFTVYNSFSQSNPRVLQ